MFPETVAHEGLACIHGEEVKVGRKWGCWEDMDAKSKWASRVKEAEKMVVVDLVETFFSKLDLR